MPLIITATDFSEIAENAVKYACNLAMDQKADLLVIHSYLLPLVYDEVQLPGAFLNDTQENAERQMKQLVGNLKLSYDGMNIRGRVVYGDFIDAINDSSDEGEKPLLVVLGNSSVNGDGAWPDSSLTEALHNLRAPVLAVPPGMVYKAIRKICFAFDNKPFNHAGILEHVVKVTHALHAKLHILNIRTETGHQDQETDFIRIAKDIFSELNPHYHTVFEVNDVDGAIHDFVQINGFDLLVMVPRRHTFFDALFHKSHTRSATTRGTVPILAIQDRHS